MSDDEPGAPDSGGWLDGTDVPSFFVSAPGAPTVVVFLRAGAFDEPLPLSGITEIALRAAVAALPAGHAVRETRVDGLLSTIALTGSGEDVDETLLLLAAALREPHTARIAAELRRARASVDARERRPRELHLAKRFGSRGPGLADLPRYGAFKAEPDDVAAHAGRIFVAANAALLVLGEQPGELPFELPEGVAARRAPAATLDGLNLPARDGGPHGGVSASMELPGTPAGRLAFRVLASRLQARGTPPELSAGVEQVGDGELIGFLAAPVGDAFLADAGRAIVEEVSRLARVAPSGEELRAASAAWLADIGTAAPDLGSYVVSQSLLGERIASRSQLVDRLWEVDPDSVSLAAQLMTSTLLVLLPRGSEIDELDALAREPPAPAQPPAGSRYRPVGMAIDWTAHARGLLFVGEQGVSQAPRRGAVLTQRFDDVALVVDYDGGSLVLIGSSSWMQVDTRLWKGGDEIRPAILARVPADRVVPMPGGPAAIAAAQTFAGEQQQARRGLTKALAILFGTIAFVVALGLWASSRVDEPRQGGCASVAGGAATRTGCDAPGAESRLLSVLVSGDGRQCPAQTDAIVAMAGTVTESGCLRSLRPPHAGERGGGGGILLAGDCIRDPASGLAGPEARCGSNSDFATVAAIATDPARCPPGALDFVRRATLSPRAILCLARGPGVLGAGDCVTDPGVTETIEVACGAPEAAFRVTRRVAARERCRAGEEAALVPRALPRAAVACLRRA